MKRAPAALYWCGNVVIDRRGDQLGKVLVCVHAVCMLSRERRWFVLERPRRDTNGGSETEKVGFNVLPGREKGWFALASRNYYFVGFERETLVCIRKTAARHKRGE